MTKKGKKWIVQAAPCMATLSFHVLTLPKPKDGIQTILHSKVVGTLHSIVGTIIENEILDTIEITSKKVEFNCYFTCELNVVS